MSSWLSETEEKFSQLEDKALELNQSEEEKEKKNLKSEDGFKNSREKKSEDGLRDFWDNMKRADIGIIGLTKWKERGRLLNWRKKINENFPNLGKGRAM